MEVEEQVGEMSGAVWEQKVKVDGIDAPNPFENWDELTDELGVRPYLVKNIKNAKYKKPSPVQSQVIPAMIKQNEVLVTAPTGSGKTLSYLVPLFHLLNKPKTGGVRAIVIIPTRELATQIETEAKKLIIGKTFRVCLLTQVSGKALNADLDESNVIKNADLLIATPARLLHIIENRILNLTSVLQIILDESDKLLGDGFVEQMDIVLSACQNPSLIVSMFSATVSPAIENLANSIMKAPLQIVVGVRNAAVKNVIQSLVYCGDENGKLLALRERIRIGISPPVLMFVQTKERAAALFRELVYDDINVDLITGDRTAAQRDEVILQFRKGKIWFLIATDLMARGIDFKGVNLVINYDMPTSPVDYIHRIGRTGRMGASGEAITYYTDDDVPFLRKIVNVLKNSDQEVAGWLQTFKADKLLIEKLAKLKELQHPTLPNDKKRSRTDNNNEGLNKKQKFNQENKNKNFQQKKFEKNPSKKNFQTRKEENKKFEKKNSQNFEEQENQKFEKKNSQKNFEKEENKKFEKKNSQKNFEKGDQKFDKNGSQNFFDKDENDKKFKKKRSQKNFEKSENLKEERNEKVKEIKKIKRNEQNVKERTKLKKQKKQITVVRKNETD